MEEMEMELISEGCTPPIIPEDDGGAEKIVMGTPPQLKEMADAARGKLIPRKSEDRYRQVYDRFIKWRAKKQTDSFSEGTVLSYFHEIAPFYAPNTMWSIYSMLKKLLRVKHSVVIDGYKELNMYLTQYSKGYRPKKAKSFTRSQIENFITTASDEVYLVEKVACLLGLAGACRRVELTNLCMDDVKLNNGHLLVTLKDTKNYKPREFAIVDSASAIIQKYIDLRPPQIRNHGRFFINYQKGRCTTQPIGINKIGKIPTTIANFLGLPDAHLYTGHSFRATSATLVVQAGATQLQLKNVGGWTSDQTAEGYIRNDEDNMMNTAEMIMNNIHIPDSRRGSLNVSSNSEPKQSSTTSRARSTLPPTVIENRLSEQPSSSHSTRPLSSTTVNCVDETNNVLIENRTQTSHSTAPSMNFHHCGNITVTNNYYYNN